MRLPRRLVTILGFALLAVLVPASPALAAPPDGAVSIPVSWNEPRGAFDGQLIVHRFVAVQQNIVADATLQGTVNSRYGPEPVDEPASPTVLAITATCQALHLELGPLRPHPPSGVELRLERLAVDVAAANLSPAGRRHLCALARALDRGASAAVVARRLNRLLPDLAQPGAIG
jgi:hypothetical protein